MSVKVLYEDNHILVLDKPPGMPSQGDPSGDLSMLDWGKEYIGKKYNKPGKVFLALVHRLDRPVGGVMIFGRTSKGAARLSKQFHDRLVQKTYYALVERTPDNDQDVLVHFLRQLQGKNIMRAHKEKVKDGKRSELSYKVLKSYGTRALLEVRPKTGRKHQIRVQLAANGCTIVGDVKYGRSKFMPDKSICLLAKKLEVKHPVTKEDMVFESEIPATWKPYQK